MTLPFSNYVLPDSYETVYIDTVEGAKDLLNELMAQEEVVFDAECCDSKGRPTTNVTDAFIVLTSYCWSPEFSVVLYGDLFKHLKPWVESQDHKKIGHNLAFDKAVTENPQYGMTFRGYFGETMFLAWAEDCNRAEEIGGGELGLEGLVEKRYGMDPLHFEKVWGCDKKKRIKDRYPSMWDVLNDPEHPKYNREQAIHYAGEDAWTEYHLFQDLKGVMVDRGYWDTYVNTDVEFLKVLLEMEKTGIRLDINVLEEIEESITKRVARNLHVWRRTVSPYINPNSTKQKQELFFSHQLAWCHEEETLFVARDGEDHHDYQTCGCSDPHSYYPDQVGKANDRWPQGAPSTGAKVIERLAKEGCYAAQVLRDIGSLKHIRSSFARRFISGSEAEVLESKTIWTAHTRWNPYIKTGRTSGRPNHKGKCGTLQNVPADPRKDPYKIRRAFISRPGHVLLVADYAQLELRILAHLSGDDNLSEAFFLGQDPHSSTAVKAFGLDCSPSEVKEKHKMYRDISKVLNFGIPYGSGAKTVADTIGCSPVEAERFISQWFDAYPAVKSWLQEAKQSARDLGYTSTVGQRRRYLPNIQKPRPWGEDQYAKELRNAIARDERIAGNNPIQGSAADLIKQAQVNIRKNEELNSYGFRQLLQIHDELVAEVPIQYAARSLELMVFEMENALDLRVPLKVEGNIGKSWEEAK